MLDKDTLEVSTLGNDGYEIESVLVEPESVDLQDKKF